MIKNKKMGKGMSGEGDDVTGGVDVEIEGKMYKNVVPGYKPKMMMKVEKKVETKKTPIQNGKKWIQTSNGKMKA